MRLVSMLASAAAVDASGSLATRHVAKGVIAGIILMMASQAPVLAASSKDKDWPCIQRKVAEISIGTVWAGAPLDVDDQSWRKDKGVVALVEKSVSRRLETEQAKEVIDDFLRDNGKDKRKRLVQAFTGQFQLINQERREIIAGIARYARTQLNLALKIKEKIDELNILNGLKSATAEQIKRREQLSEQLNWDTRVYDEREQSLRYVCETPVLLEQRLFALGRHIAEHLAE